MKKFIQTLFLLFIIIISFSCKKEIIKTETKKALKSNVKYAKGFDIIHKNGIKKLIIKSAYQNSNEILTYKIKNKTDKKISVQNTIYTPIQNLVVTSTTHIPMIELLNEETSIIGFPNSKYISSEKTRVLIDEGKITEIGKESSLNTEVLLDLQPKLVVGFSVSSADKSLTTIKKAGIPVLKNNAFGSITTHSTKSDSTSRLRISPSPPVFELKDPLDKTKPALPCGAR